MNKFILCFIYNILTTVICKCGDTLTQKQFNKNLMNALIDNGTHGAIGFTTGLTIITLIDKKYCNLLTKCLLVILCGCLSSLIDLDHFIAAKSLQLKVLSITQ